MYFISSISNNDCLFTDLKIVLANLNKDSNYLFLSNPHVETPFTFSEIKSIGESYGLTIQGFQCESLNDITSNKYPIIVIITNADKKTKHAIIIKKIRKKDLVIIDPSFGKMTMKKDDFNQVFDGYGLLISDYRKTKCPEKPIKTIQYSDIFFVSLLQVFSGVSCLVGTYFISSEFPFYISVVLFAFFFIFEIVLRRYLVYVMEKMDKKFLYSIKGKIDYYSYFERYTKMKTHNILTVTDSLFATIIFVFLIAVLIMNNWLNLIYVGVVIVLSLITRLLIKPKFDIFSSNISKLESCLKSLKNNKEFVELTTEINKKGYRYGLTTKTIRYLQAGIFLITIILVMALSSNTINITYVIFYLTIMMVMSQYFDQMLNVSDSYQKYLEGRNYINQYYR